MNDTVRLPGCPSRGREPCRVERLLLLTHVTRILYGKRTIQQYATMPGRDTAPGFLLRRLPSRRWATIWGNEPTLLNRNTGRGSLAIQVTVQGGNEGPSIRCRCHTP